MFSHSRKQTTWDHQRFLVEVRIARSFLLELTAYKTCRNTKDSHTTNRSFCLRFSKKQPKKRKKGLNALPLLTFVCSFYTDWFKRHCYLFCRQNAHLAKYTIFIMIYMYHSETCPSLKTCPNPPYMSIWHYWTAKHA